VRVLITGGAGFIGSNLVRFLMERHPTWKVYVLDALTYAGNLDNLPAHAHDDPRFRFVHGNIRNSALVEELVAETDVVLHLAAETHVPRSVHDNVAFVETDVLGTQVVLNAALKHPVERFIHVSTSEVYGTAAQVPMTEEHPLNPTTPYAGAKAGADRLVYAYHATYGLPCVIVRPFNTYGPYQHLEKAIPRFITAALSDTALIIHGDGSTARDWGYVDDLCLGLEKAVSVDLATVRGQVINLGTGIDTPIKQVAELVVDRLGKSRSLIVYSEDRPGQVRRHIAGVERARQLLGWRAEVPFEAGLDRTIRWYAAHRSWWEKLVWMKSVTIIGPGGQKVTY
jgi:dTDP-glucose 4,6-dehydratase